MRAAGAVWLLLLSHVEEPVEPRDVLPVCRGISVEENCVER